MKILIIDDSIHVHTQLRVFLTSAGYNDLVFSESVETLLALLEKESQVEKPYENVKLVLMDIEMDGMDGITATQRLKSIKAFNDTPVIMVTGDNSNESLQAAFDAGAVDYITKPIRRVELLARVASFLKLKQESDALIAREKELVELTFILENTNTRLRAANEKLSRMAMVDGLTGVANRRYFDKTLVSEWQRGLRQDTPLSMLMIDVDFFKLYNDIYGHQMGDKCLTKIAGALQYVLKRPSDVIARYGGEEFCVFLPDTEITGANQIGKHMLSAVEELKIEHAGSSVNEFVTLSIGSAEMLPSSGTKPAFLVNCADTALYKAKDEGRNRLVTLPNCL